VEGNGCSGIAFGDGARGVGGLERADAADDSEHRVAGAAAGSEGLGFGRRAGVSWRWLFGAVATGFRRAHLSGVRRVVVLLCGAVEPWRWWRVLRGRGEEGKGGDARCRYRAHRSLTQCQVRLHEGIHVHTGEVEADARRRNQ
jgi:hypothetical protein